MAENQKLLTIPLRGKRAVFVTGSSDHRGPIVYVGQGEPGMFPQPATLDAEQARQVRDALTQWLVDVGAEQPAALAAEVTKLRDIALSIGHLHRMHRCDGPPEECPCADDRALWGGDVCANCTRGWPCTTATLAGAALKGGERP